MCIEHRLDPQQDRRIYSRRDPICIGFEVEVNQRYPMILPTINRSQSALMIPFTKQSKIEWINGDSTNKNPPSRP